jgi:hypothetical protein
VALSLFIDWFRDVMCNTIQHLGMRRVNWLLAGWLGSVDCWRCHTGSCEHVTCEHRLLKWDTAGKAKARQPRAMHHCVLVVFQFQGEPTKFAIFTAACNAFVMKSQPNTEGRGLWPCRYIMPYFHPTPCILLYIPYCPLPAVGSAERSGPSGPLL